MNNLLDNLDLFRNETMNLINKIDVTEVQKPVVNANVPTLTEAEQILLGEIKKKNSLITKLYEVVEEKEADLNKLSHTVKLLSDAVVRNETLVKQLTNDVNEKDEFIEEMMATNKKILENNREIVRSVENKNIELEKEKQESEEEIRARIKVIKNQVDELKKNSSESSKIIKPEPKPKKQIVKEDKKKSLSKKKLKGKSSQGRWH